MAFTHHGRSLYYGCWTTLLLLSFVACISTESDTKQEEPQIITNNNKNNNNFVVSQNINEEQRYDFDHNKEFVSSATSNNIMRNLQFNNLNDANNPNSGPNINLGNGRNNNPITVRNLPNIPINLPNIPNIPNLPNLPNMSNMPNLPNLPNMPNLPNLPNLPNMSNMPNLPNLPNMSNMPNLPNLPFTFPPNVDFSAIGGNNTNNVSLQDALAQLNYLNNALGNMTSLFDSMNSTGAFNFNFNGTGPGGIGGSWPGIFNMTPAGGGGLPVVGWGNWNMTSPMNWGNLNFNNMTMPIGWPGLNSNNMTLPQGWAHMMNLTAGGPNLNFTGPVVFGNWPGINNNGTAGIGNFFFNGTSGKWNGINWHNNGTRPQWPVILGNNNNNNSASSPYITMIPPGLVQVPGNLFNNSNLPLRPVDLVDTASSLIGNNAPNIPNMFGNILGNSAGGTTVPVDSGSRVSIETSFLVTKLTSSLNQNDKTILDSAFLAFLENSVSSMDDDSIFVRRRLLKGQRLRGMQQRQRQNADQEVGRRNLKVTIDTTTVGISLKDCPTHANVTAGLSCSIATGKYDILLQTNASKIGVQDRYVNATNYAIDKGNLQVELDRITNSTSSSSYLQIYGQTAMQSMLNIVLKIETPFIVTSTSATEFSIDDKLLMKQALEVIVDYFLINPLGQFDKPSSNTQQQQQQQNSNNKNNNATPGSSTTTPSNIDNNNQAQQSNGTQVSNAGNNGSNNNNNQEQQNNQQGNNNGSQQHNNTSDSSGGNQTDQASGNGNTPPQTVPVNNNSGGEQRRKRLMRRELKIVLELNSVEIVDLKLCSTSALSKANLTGSGAVQSLTFCHMGILQYSLYVKDHEQHNVEAAYDKFQQLTKSALEDGSFQSEIMKLDPNAQFIIQVGVLSNTEKQSNDDSKDEGTDTEEEGSAATTNPPTEEARSASTKQAMFGKFVYGKVLMNTFLFSIILHSLW